MQRFKWLAVAILSVLVFHPATAQDSREIFETIDLDRDGRVMIDTYKGSIDVTTWDREEVEIEAKIVADEHEHLVPLTEIHIRRTGSVLRIETDYKKAKKEGKRFKLFGNNYYSLPYVHYTIKMPRTADLRIEDYKSEISVESLVADLDLETYKGEVEITDVAGDIRIDTYKGDVVATELAGSLEADTYKGNILAEFVEFSGNSTVDTYRGDIDLRLPESAGFDLDANLGKNGDLDTDFRLNNVKVEKNKYYGSIGGGGPRLEVDTYRGRIQLSAN